MLGATGTLGLKITGECLTRGAEVIALIRATSNRSDLEALGVKDLAIGDLTDLQSLRSALSAKAGPIDAVISSAAGYTRHTRGDTAKTDTVGYFNLVDAVKEAGIPRFVMISIQ